MRNFYVISLKFLLIVGAVAAQINSNTTDYEIDETNEHCDGYCFKTLKPILDDISETKTKLKNYEKLIQHKDEQISEFQKTLAALRTNELLCNEKIKHKDELIALLKQFTHRENNNINLTETVHAEANKTSEVSDFQDSHFNSSTSNESIEFQESKLNILALLYKDNVNQTEDLEIQDLPTNCVAYENSTDINEIMVPNVGRLRVLCGESGWTVVLNRFDGSENFYRNWADYRKGFGKLQGEFFIGLEALHQMTSSERHELYIELTDFHYNVREARYDNFVIGSNGEKYKLKTIGSYSGDAGDALRYNLGNEFTTFDSDNDNWSGGNSAEFYSSAGWFDWNGSHLFGKYFSTEVNDKQSIWWHKWKGFQALSSVKLMIRPMD